MITVVEEHVLGGCSARLDVGLIEATNNAQHLAQVGVVPVDSEQRHPLQLN